MNRLFWLGLFSAATACAPSTQYRRSALVPPAHALAWDGRTAERGTLRLEGAISHANVDTDLLPQVGDSALLVPQTVIEGAAGLAVTRGFELGFRYAHADYSWARENAIGTPPIPGDPSLNGFGPEARGTIRFGRTEAFALGIAGNIVSYSIPVAEWEKNSTCTFSRTCIPGWSWTGDRYQFVSQDTKTKAAISVAIYPSYEFGGGKYGHIFGGLAISESFKNDGFSDNVSGSKVASNGFVPIVGVGYGFHYEYFRMSVMLDYPVTSRGSAVYYTYGGEFPLNFFLTLGVDLPLWGKKADAPAPAAGG